MGHQELIIIAVAYLASLLTFFSGFGLGTLLMPVMMIWFPPHIAIAMTGIVHFFNSMFKLTITYKHVNLNILKRFGVPAFIAAFLGSALLSGMTTLPEWGSYKIFGIEASVSPLKFTTGVLLLFFVGMEAHPKLKAIKFSDKYLPVGGLLSGFFGGLTGNQGALRSAFLIKAGVTKESFIATGAAISAGVDLTRSGKYFSEFGSSVSGDMASLVVVATFAAIAGVLTGNRFLKKTTFSFLQQTVTVMLLLLSLSLAAGII